MVEETIQSERVQQLISVPYLGNHIDEMIKTWLCQTQRYTNRPQSGDPLYQRVMAQLQQRNYHHSFINSFSLAYSTTTEVISERYNGLHQFLRKTKVPENTILVSMDVTSLCTKYTARGGNKHGVQRIKSLPQN